MKKAYIKAISYYLPEKKLSNEDLIKDFPEWTIEKVALKIGVSVRHISGEQECASDLAFLAAKKIFKEYFINPEDIDFVLLCTQSPDYFLPTTACILQHKLGISTKAGALDFNLGCSGYIYGLSIAKGLICAGVASNILFLTSETYTKHLHPKDKSSRTIFGDGASATLISTEGFAEIKNFSLGTDGSGAQNLIKKTGGLRNPDKLNDITFDEAIMTSMSKVVASNNLKAAAENEGQALLITKTKAAEAEGNAIKIKKIAGLVLQTPFYEGMMVNIRSIL